MEKWRETGKYWASMAGDGGNECLSIMCGRFTNRLTWSAISALYNLNGPDPRRNIPARYNISPTQDILFARMNEHGDTVLDEGRWSLVPHWAKALPKVAMFNARMETVVEKPAFRDAMKGHRCLIPADGYYEWTPGADGQKDPWYVHLAGERGFSFAGLWAHNQHLASTSCTIITAPASAAVSGIHDRMPVILNEGAYDEWLDPSTPAGVARNLLSRNLNDSLEFYRVDRAVNSSRYQGTDAIKPV